MGWCHEFGVQIQPDCGHPMQADRDSCVCIECGTVCTGHFGGCPDVWARGPVPVTLIPSRPVTVPQVDEREPVLIVSTPPGRPGSSADQSFAPPPSTAARPQPPPVVGQGQDRDRLLSVLASTFRELQLDIRAIAENIARQDAMLAELARSRQAEARIAELAETLPDRLGAAIAAAIEARQEGYLRRFDEVVNTIATQLATSLPKRLGSAIADAVEERQDVMVRLVERSSEELRAHLGDTLAESLAQALPARIGAETASAIEAREHDVVARIGELADGLGARVAESIANQLGPALVAATQAGQQTIAAQVRSATAELRDSLAEVQASAAAMTDEARGFSAPDIAASGWANRSNPTVEQAVDRAVHSVLRRAGGGVPEAGRHPSFAADPFAGAHVDAGGPEDISDEERAEIDKGKAALRAKVWKSLTKAKAARFPGAEGRIPNFVGAEAAAQLLQDLDEWIAAAVVKANPDAPQWPVRERALADGKILYMAVPRLAGDKPFYFLDGEDLEETPRRSSSIKGAARVAQTVSLHAVEPIDIVITGCVAVGRDGARLGKGGGYSDLEFALLSQAAVIGPETLVVTTAHPLQVREPGDVPTAPHDLWVDVIVTPDEVIRCNRDGSRPGGRMRWDQLSDAQLAAIPVLRDLRPA
jgi:5-formyltetrahydrofolate cyclo-ligase